MSWFRKTKIEPEVRKRSSVDGIRLVLRTQKKAAKGVKTNIFMTTATVIFACAIILVTSFYATVAVYAVKNKADALKIFKQGTYLVLFQNNAEMRPAGGFIGSFAIVTFDNYKIKKIDFNTNIFKLDNAYTAKTQVVPPTPLAIIAQNRWALRDSNFAVDFPTAAQNVQWFYAQETKDALNPQDMGQKVDGVIAINASLLQDFLRLTGPINMEKYDITISADNFFEVLAQKIEKEYFNDLSAQGENEPKTILKDMMPIVMARATDLPKAKLIKFGLDALNQKLVLFQSNNAGIQQAILNNNWGGEIQDTKSDYLAINNANITDLAMQKNGGAKTSLKIKESIDYKVESDEAGLVGRLSLTRSHTGSYAWPDGVNVNWTRILVPQGTELIRAELNGQDIKDKVEVGSESGKTVFGLWINTAPQTSNVLNLTYKLPIPTSNYSLLVQKQPGNTGDQLSATFKDAVLYNGWFNEDLSLKLK
ncbi:MAG: DUF4012 domain-containing protein [Candidatus Berkelbacteria bacterium]